MTTPNSPIYIDQDNGTYKKYEGTIERLRATGWPDFLPAGSVTGAGSVSPALNHVYSRDDIQAMLLTLKPPTEKDWETFKQFIAIERAD